MQQAEVPFETINSFFMDGYIDTVEVSRSNREWTFRLVKSTLVPQHIYRSFCKMIQDKFSHIARIRFVVRFEESVSSSELVEEYWSLFIEWVQREAASINGWLTKAKVEVQDQTIHLIMLDAIGMELARKKNLDQFIRSFF